MSSLKVKRLSSNALLPTRAHPTDAGVDLYYSEFESTEIEAHSFRRLKLKLAIELPPNTVGLIQGKSGLAGDYGITTIGNVIDEGYSGEISVVLMNNSDHSFKVFPGMKLAQLLVIPVLYPTIVEVDEVAAGPRGANGFGSTGLTKENNSHEAF